MPRRDEILDIARTKFAQNGYSGTSMRDIADASGLLAGSLYSHFGSKAELVRDIVVGFYDELMPRQRAVLDNPGTGLEQFQNMLAEAFKVCAAHRNELTILHYDWHVLSSSEELSDVREMSVETLDLWRTVLDAGKADGSIEKLVDTEAMVRVTTSSMHALIDTVRYSDRPVPQGKTNELGAMLVRVLTSGIEPGNGTGGSRGRGRSSVKPAVAARKKGNRG